MRGEERFRPTPDGGLVNALGEPRLRADGEPRLRVDPGLDRGERRPSGRRCKPDTALAPPYPDAAAAVVVVAAAVAVVVRGERRLRSVPGLETGERRLSGLSKAAACRTTTGGGGPRPGSAGGETEPWISTSKRLRAPIGRPICKWGGGFSGKRRGSGEGGGAGLVLTN